MVGEVRPLVPPTAVCNITDYWWCPNYELRKGYPMNAVLFELGVMFELGGVVLVKLRMSSRPAADNVM